MSGLMLFLEMTFDFGSVSRVVNQGEESVVNVVG